MNITGSINKSIVITPNSSKQRIDNFLFKSLKKIPKSMIYRSLRTGRIKINQKKVRPYYKLKVNDCITLHAISIEIKKKKFF